MMLRFRAFLERVRGSYWFVPMTMAVGAFALARVTIGIDERVPFEIIRGVRFIYLNQPEGARALLSTVAGSMITVAGVVFSITMVVLSLASSQFGPRLLGNFMRDRGNQIVLGTFVATFLYCLMVLRTVHNSLDGIDDSLFVPHVSVTVAVLLTVFNLGVFIYFIHHTAASIQVSNVLAGISNALQRKIDALFPEERPFLDRLGPAGPAREAELPHAFEHGSVTVAAPRSGYLQTFDLDGLRELAREEEALIRLRHAPGDFIMRGSPLADVYPGRAARALAPRIVSRTSLGSARSPSQDLPFLFDQLLEVGVRALSPGINDPFTAMTCIDRICDALYLLSGRVLPRRETFDGDRLRLIGPGFDLAALAQRLLGELRVCGCGDALVAHHLLAKLAELHELTAAPELRPVLVGEALDLLTSAREALPVPDAQRLEAAFDARFGARRRAPAARERTP